MSLVVLGYIAAALSMVGILLNAKKLIWCWVFFLLGSILWIVYSGIDGDIPSVILWVTFSLFNIYGWIQWRKDKKPKGYSGGKYNYKAGHPMDFPTRRNGF